MRLSDEGHLVVGVFEPQEKRIVIRRDQLRDPVHYCGTLLHELTHAGSGYTDGTLEFEEALTHQLGTIMVSLINTSSPHLATRADITHPDYRADEDPES